MYYIWTRKPSRGARRLAWALKGKVVRPGPQPFVVVNGLNVGLAGLGLSDSDVVINWGDSQCPVPFVLNNPANLRVAANKLLAFRAFRDAGVPTPRFAETPDDVSWDGMTVVRHRLTGHSGEGIEIVQPGDSLPDAPLYVEYIKKEQEYRIHVGVRGSEKSLIAIQRKARRHDVPSSAVNWQVRNHANGFVFVRQGVNPPTSCTEAAFDALGCLGLDFGAVDIIWNEQKQKAFVLEVNSAPGLEGQTVEDYRAFFTGMSASSG